MSSVARTRRLASAAASRSGPLFSAGDRSLDERRSRSFARRRVSASRAGARESGASFFVVALGVLEAPVGGSRAPLGGSLPAPAPAPAPRDWEWDWEWDPADPVPGPVPSPALGDPPASEGEDGAYSDVADSDVSGGEGEAVSFPSAAPAPASTMTELGLPRDEGEGPPSASSPDSPREARPFPGDGSRPASDFSGRGGVLSSRLLLALFDPAPGAEGCFFRAREDAPFPSAAAAAAAAASASSPPPLCPARAPKKTAATMKTPRALMSVAATPPRSVILSSSPSAYAPVFGVFSDAPSCTRTTDAVPSAATASMARSFHAAGASAVSRAFSVWQITVMRLDPPGASVNGAHGCTR